MTSRRNTEQDSNRNTDQQSREWWEKSRVNLPDGVDPAIADRDAGKRQQQAFAVACADFLRGEPRAADEERR